MNTESKNNSRRQFLVQSVGIALVAALPGIPRELFGRERDRKLTILHTNDTHSRIDPFPSNDPHYPDMGGIARRAAIINKIRREEQNVLLLDSGDIYQGTPYFNMYGGSIEFQMMSLLKYDAATMGNHDFDIGLDGFERNLIHAGFPFLCSNYDFTNTILHGKTQPYKIFIKEGLRVGVFGVGIELKGLVNPGLYGETKYLDPIETANDVAKKLRVDKKCHFVICLSHLGYFSTHGERVTDMKLARKSENIDLILGGHSHTFLDQPVAYINKTGREVLVAQAGFAGLRLGRIDVYFDKGPKQENHTTQYTPDLETQNSYNIG